MRQPLNHIVLYYDKKKWHMRRKNFRSHMPSLANLLLCLYPVHCKKVLSFFYLHELTIVTFWLVSIVFFRGHGCI